VRVLMATMFFPRGGSAHVTRSLARRIEGVRVVSGSVRGEGDARRFYSGLDLHPVDMSAALDAPDPLLADVPLHPSYEDRPDAADRVFAALGEDVFEHQVRAWSRALEAAGAAEADVLHLHHLTPVHAAAERVAPDVPVVSHLHGTEMAMLERGDEAWPHARAWRERMQAWAQRSARVLVLTEDHATRAVELLGVEAERCVVVPNGFDAQLFRPQPVERWEGTTFVTVSRFTAVKRLPLLIEAWADLDRPDARLVIVGGHPGEHEGEHPADAIARTGARDVELAGWHEHDALPAFFNAADVVVLASVREQFGQVLVEGMACGLPAIAVDAHGPATIVEDGRTGWLVPPDDREALTEALRAAVDDPAERRRRGALAREDVCARFTWDALAGRVAEVHASAAQAGTNR
jgi:glycosyltransferase involved in cell wall biosynthesis